MATDKELEAITTLANKRSDNEYSWFKHAISTISILLGLLITFSDKNDIYFKITTSIFGLNILSGLIFLYDEVLIPHRMIQSISKKQNIYQWNNGTKTIVSNRGRIFIISKIVFFWTLILSVVSLIVFAWNK